MYGIRHALPIMIEQKSGSIINTMSSAEWKGATERVAYQAAKSGLVGLTRHTATLGGKHGVRANLLSPSVTPAGAPRAQSLSAGSRQTPRKSRQMGVHLSTYYR